MSWGRQQGLDHGGRTQLNWCVLPFSEPDSWTRAAALANAELRTLFLLMLRADWELVDRYRPSGDRVLGCPIAVFGGIEDRIPKAHLEAWRDHTTGDFALQYFPGSHFFIQSAETDVLASIAARIESVAASAPGLA